MFAKEMVWFMQVEFLKKMFELFQNSVDTGFWFIEGFLLTGFTV